MCADVPDRHGNLRVTSGDEVKLPCYVSPSDATNVKWLQTEYVPIGPSLVYNISVNDQIIIEGLRWRFSIYNAAVGDYSLKILNIKDDDAGRYRCLNGEQLISNYLIYVSGEYCACFVSEILAH